MSHQPTEPVSLPVSATMVQLRHRKTEATQALLGTTIAISDEAWQQPSRLPGWTRAHVATHLARNADALARVARGLLAGSAERMYPGEAQRMRALEAGSLRGALELQIDLDTSAGLLNEAFDLLEDSQRDDEVELTAGFRMPVSWLTIVRLDEVVLHHIDLDCGFTIRDVDADSARWLLEWNCLLAGDRIDLPALRLVSSSGVNARIGDPADDPREVHGSDAALLGWLTSRGDAELLSGAEGITLPQL